MRRAGRIVAEVLALMEEELKPGVTTAAARRRCRELHPQGRRPALVQGLQGLPGEHLRLDRRRGRPRDTRQPRHRGRPGRLGRCRRHLAGLSRRRRPDVLRRDAAAPMSVRLIDTTRLALMAGIAAAVPGAHIDDVSGAVEDVAVEGRCDIVRPYVGHGIGTRMHEDLQVPNYRTGRPRRRAGAGRLHRHRADAHARQRRRRRRWPTAGPSSPRIIRWPPTSSTRSP